MLGIALQSLEVPRTPSGPSVVISLPLPFSLREHRHGPGYTDLGWTPTVDWWHIIRSWMADQYSLAGWLLAT